MKLAFLILASLISIAAFAQGPDKPDRKPAPVEKRDKAVALARKQYLAAVMSAERACIQDLNAAIANAGKNGNSDKVTELAEAKKAAEQRFEAAKAEVDGKTIRADQDWQPTIEVAKGQIVKIEAKGKWCLKVTERTRLTCGPDGMFDTNIKAECGYLEAKIGDGLPVRIGHSGSFTAEDDGMLYLRQNDTDHSDNDGQVSVAITHE